MRTDPPRVSNWVLTVNRNPFRPTRPAPLHEPAPPPIVTRYFKGAGDFGDCAALSRRVRGPGVHDQPIAMHMGRGSPTIGIVAEFAGRFAGYLLVLPRCGGLEVADIAVDPAWRRRGVGTHLMGWLRSRLGAVSGGPDRTWIVAEVGESRTDLLCFLRDRGFRALPGATGRYLDGGIIHMVFDAGPVDADCDERRAT